MRGSLTILALAGLTLVVTGPQGLNLRFAKVGQEWKIKLPQQEKALLQAVGPLMQELATAFSGFADEMTLGINSGSITKDNLQAKFDELGKKHVEPVMEKFFGAMMKQMQPAPPTTPDTSL